MAELLEQQFLTLSLKGEKYAIPVGRVLEVLEYAKVTRLPCMTAYLKGLINLRGKGVPVLDLALRFGLQETEVAKDTAIVVVEMVGEEGALVVGLIADSVHEVVEINSDLVEDAPKFGAGSAQDFLKGVGRKDEHFILILDIDRLFKDDEVRIPAEEAEAIGA
jgi:purine-binding chemotaxis protein CheW